MLIRICLAHGMTCVSAISLKVVEENMYVFAKCGLQDDNKYVTIRKCCVLVLSRCVIEKLQGMTTVETYEVYWHNSALPKADPVSPVILNVRTR